jgi:hypothetical protein
MEEVVERLKIYVAVAVGVMTFGSFFGCAAKVKSDGACSRISSCSIGGGKLRGSPISNSSGLALTCSAGAVMDPFEFEFLIYEDTKVEPASSGNVPPRIPQAGISFTPQIPYGATLLTPASEWCTDSCGIAKIKFDSKCAEQKSFVSVYAKGMILDEPNGASVSFTMEYP